MRPSGFGLSRQQRAAALPEKEAGMTARKQRWSATPGWWPRVGPLAREWLTLELLGHGGLILLRQLCGTGWNWQLGGPFAYWDATRSARVCSRNGAGRW